MQNGPVQDFTKTSLLMDDSFKQASGLRVNRKSLAVVKHGTGFHNHKLVVECFQLYSLAWSKVGGILKAVHFQTKSILLHHQPGFKRVKLVDMDTIISEPVSSRQSSCMNPSILIVGCIHVFSSKKFKFPRHWLKIAIIKNNQLYMMLICEKQSHYRI